MKKLPTVSEMEHNHGRCVDSLFEGNGQAWEDSL